MRRYGAFLLAAAALACGLTAGCKEEASGAAGSSAGSSGTGTAGSHGGDGTTTSSRPAPSKEGNSIQGDTIRIGLVASQNGDLKPWGDDSIKGAQLAVDEINKAGGIKGKQVQLLVGDSASKPEQGKSAAQKLVGTDKVIGLLGEVASGITQQMANVAFDEGVPLIAVGATKTDITKQGSNLFRVCYTDDFQGPVMAKFAYEELGLRNVAVMTDNKQPYSQYLSETFKNAFVKLGGKIADEQFYETGTTQFNAQIGQMKSKNPDGAFLSGYFNEVGPIASQMRQAGINVPLMGGDGWDSTQLQTSGGQAIIGGFFCNHYNNQEDRPVVKDFLSKWQAKYGGTPGTTMGALGYDAAMLMMDAIKRAEGDNGAAVTRALEATEGFAGVSGDITLNGKNGDPPKRALVVEVVKDGQAFKKAYDPSDLADLK
ncbi:MAG: ABC transporter substrate-binding protein [Fimbriimonadaceae bacterium]|nr:ABC transporter substrate-binding protein [Fimbriimonadaceae bacterium]QYK55384.1 MAG: ABC transporter substrate-binding protein [Fimbriimonadaceae bacterium]